MIRWIAAPIVVGVLAVAAPAYAAPPEDATFELLIDANAPTGSCSFPVLVEPMARRRPLTCQVEGRSSSHQIRR